MLRGNTVGAAFCCNVSNRRQWQLRCTDSCIRARQSDDKARRGGMAGLGVADNGEVGRVCAGGGGVCGLVGLACLQKLH